MSIAIVQSKFVSYNLCTQKLSQLRRNFAIFFKENAMEKRNSWKKTFYHWSFKLYFLTVQTFSLNQFLIYHWRSGLLEGFFSNWSGQYSNGHHFSGGYRPSLCIGFLSMCPSALENFQNWLQAVPISALCWTSYFWQTLGPSPGRT